MADAPSDRVEIYRAGGLPEAHALVLLLDGEGIPAWIDNELLQAALGDLPLGWATAPRVTVSRAQEAAARALLARFQKPPAGTPRGAATGDLDCLACGATMGTAHACPACGWSYRQDPEPDAEPPAAGPEAGTAAPASGTEAIPSPGGAESPSGLSRPALWGEVAAVLAVGVVPNLAAAVASACSPTPPPPYWVDAVQLTALSGCQIFVTLYLIHRSGEGWGRFGIARPRGSDLVLGLVLTTMAGLLWAALPDFPSGGSKPGGYPFPLPRYPADFALLVVKYGTATFAEELVTRAYLVTRLEVLLRSRTEAVLVAAVLFASYHIYQGAEAVVYALAFGVMYGAVFLVLRRVWPLAVGHALYDIQIELLAV
ncbi:MAG: putative conserved integral rane protein [Gemmataceae bacterium]|nr:putative conserved integral rane protein [Gemmataceae bacterium]